MNKFDSIKIGEKAEVTHKVAQSDVDNFIKLTGDDNKLHVDKVFASKTAFKKPVAHGMIGASFISTVIGTKIPGDGALWLSQSLEFLLPVRVGDTLTVKAEVTNKNNRTHTIELNTDIFNQNGQKVTAGKAQVKIIELDQQTVKTELIDKNNRVALVIGGTGGIGRATCIQLAKDGFHVAVHYNSNKSLAEEIRSEIISLKRKSIIVKADITDIKQTKDMMAEIVRKFDFVTAIANCATTNIPTIKFKELDWATVQGHFDINVKGAFNILKSAVPIMDERKYGKIINITSCAVEKPSSEWLHYITAKSALQGFTKALAFELAPKGIRLNLVSPSMTNTDLIAGLPERVKLLTEAQTPLRRIAQPVDIADAISFLASEKSDFITGETIRVNGGQMML
jgi:3-oxoacyl-[acyl-carrier protein] reductase